MLVLMFIVMCAYSFFLVDLSLHTGLGSKMEVNYDSKNVQPSNAQFCNWCIFALLLILTLWSCFKMVFSSPGYIPPNYMYEEVKLSPHDRLIYQTLRHALHSSEFQKIEALEAEGILQGSLSSKTAS